MENNQKIWESKTRLYNILRNMKARCSNPNNDRFRDYGGRGITVCDEWKNDYYKFKEWALENGYENHLTIDRIDNNGNYEPSNCRWTTLNIQQHNSSLLMRTNTSGYRGAYLDKRRNKWYSQIVVFRKKTFLGMFDTKLEAALAYDKYVKDNNLEHTTNF